MKHKDTRNAFDLMRQWLHHCIDEVKITGKLSELTLQSAEQAISSVRWLAAEVNDAMYTCCLCGVSRSGYGNNPDPITDTVNTGTRCCDYCNHTRVIPARLASMEFKDSK